MKRDLVDEMNNYYEQRAPWHDKFMNYQSQAATEKLLAPIIADVQADVAGKDVLEIACGTGNWTQVLAARARSVLATDISKTSIEIARSKPYQTERVAFRIADAYTLEGVEGEFDAAFASDWWSHIPRQKIGEFLRVLHSHLRPGAIVFFLEILGAFKLHRSCVDFDDHGNEIHRRRIPSGATFHVVRNFYNEEQLREILSPYARDFRYREYPSLTRWLVRYVLS
jgi:demethylmenaquinone methyltransferase/2-methoxy-6-polyprenyl-1,4-benzoquinol methylase